MSAVYRCVLEKIMLPSKGDQYLVIVVIIPVFSVHLFICSAVGDIMLCVFGLQVDMQNIY